MVDVVLVLREPGELRPAQAWRACLPALPRVGDCITVSGPDDRPPLGSDMIASAVWWVLDQSGPGRADEELAAEFVEVFVECTPAEGPYSSAGWRTQMAAARRYGVEIPTFRVSRSVVGTEGDVRAAGD
jgi:hypothetical protein